jgi:hypothetical protein
MTIAYEVICFTRSIREEFNSEAEAKAFAETLPEAKLITWAVHPNLPNALPKDVYNSCALRVWKDGAWRNINIFEGGNTMTLTDANASRHELHAALSFWAANHSVGSRHRVRDAIRYYRRYH